MALLDALLLDPYALNFWIAQRGDGMFGSGTAADPWSGSGANFDVRMKDIVDRLIAQQAGQTLKLGARVFLGPGTFTTKGYSDEDLPNSSLWSPVTGLKIIGAGVDVTSLQLANTSTATAQFYAVGHRLDTSTPKASHFEISDLTIDCNLANNGASLGCGAVRVFGDHVRIRRVKAINWGTKNNSKRCFVFAAITAAPSPSYEEALGLGIEDCIAITPASTAQPVTVFHAGAREEPSLTTPREPIGTAPFIRNCFVDAGLTTPSPTGNVRALSLGTCRGGVAEGNQVLNVDVAGPYQDRGTTRDVVVRGNVFKNVARGPYWKLGAVITTANDALTGLVRESSSPPGNQTAIATTANAAHGFQVGDVVELAGNTPTEFNGVFLVRNVPAANQFKVQRSSGFSGNATVLGTARKLLATGKVWILDNYCEQTPGVSPIAIHLDDNSKGAGPDYLYSEVLIRGNQIRYLDGPIPTASGDVAIQVNGGKKVTLGDNLIESANPNPIQTARCSLVQTFNNLDPADFIRQAEDALMMSLLARR